MSFFRNVYGEIYRFYISVALVITVIFIIIDFYFISALSIGLFAYFLLITLDKLGKEIPIKEVLVLLFLVQMVITPLITYHVFEGKAISIKMYVQEKEYINYVFFAILALIVGLNKIENRKEKSLYFPENGRLGLIFVFIGAVGDLGTMLEIQGLGFLFFIIRSFKFAGTFFLLFSNYKYKNLVIFFVYFFLTISAIRMVLFYQIIIWGLFYFIFYSYKRKMSIIKNASFFIIGFLSLFILQIVKTQVRDLIRENDKLKNVDVFFEVSQNRLAGIETLVVDGYVEGFVGRLNTGWVVTKIMEHIPKYESYAMGEKLFSDILSSFVPRFLFPEKRTVSGEEYNKIFEKYTGRHLRKGTTVNIGMLGDMYINFGYGGIIAMFFIGKLISLLYTFLNKKGGQYIFLIPILFFNILKMNELFVILNSSIKVVLVIVLILFVLNRFFNIKIKS